MVMTYRLIGPMETPALDKPARSPFSAAMHPATQSAPRPFLAAADALILALWVSICAVAPEFIWRGGRIALAHADADMLATSLLFGLILAFCIEPGLERLRQALHKQEEEETHEAPRSLLFTALVGLIFALVSICLHDSIAAFLAGHGADAPGRHLALLNGLRIALAWAIVPFFITLAWIAAFLTTRPWRWVGFALAAASPLVTGWAFSWAWQDIVTTTLPALAILAAGWRLAPDGPLQSLFPRAAAAISRIAPLWLAAAALLSLAAHALHQGQAALYTASEFWIDARFYLGWAAGLLILPGTGHIAQSRATH
jgi:hypothetical protein